MISAETAFGMLAGLTPILAGWIGRRGTKTLRWNRMRGGGAKITVNVEDSSSVLISRDEQHAVRFKIADGRALVVWSDGKTTDIPELVVKQVLRFGTRGGMAIR